MPEETTTEALTRIADALETIRDLLADSTHDRRYKESRRVPDHEYTTVKGGY